MAHVNFINLQDGDWLKWFIVEAASQDVQMLTRAPGYNPEKLDAKLIINGIEYPLNQTIYRMGSEFEHQVYEAAKGLVEKKMQDHLSELDSLFDDVKNRLQRIIQEAESKT